MPLQGSPQKFLLKRIPTSRRILRTTSLTFLVVLLSMIVLPVAQVLHQPSGGMAPRAAAKASKAAEKLKFVMRFNSQKAANTLWVSCFFWIQFSRSLRFCCSLSCSLRLWILMIKGSSSVASGFHLLRHDRGPARGFVCQRTDS